MMALRILLLALLAFLPALSPASARDNAITTDPLAAAIMPPQGSPLFVPFFIRPPGRTAEFEAPREMLTPDKYPTPGLTPRTPQTLGKVLVTTPHDNAVFPRGSMVSFTWISGEQEINDGDPVAKPQFPLRYEIIITRHDNSGDRLFVREQSNRRHYTHLYSPPGPGRYQWQVKSIYDRAMHGANSTVRSFVVLP